MKTTPSNGKLILTRGIPASGKTTWAKEWVAFDPEKRARVNRDDLRAQLFGLDGKLTPAQEQAVTVAQKAAVSSLLAGGYDVVVDDTNLVNRFVKDWFKVTTNIEFEDFEVPRAMAIVRDRDRARTVGETVIDDFFKRRTNNGKLNPPPEVPEPLTFKVYDRTAAIGKPHAIIVDVDGTLAHMTNRGPYDTSKYMDDAVDPDVASLVRALHFLGTKVLITSGRDAEFFFVLMGWLAKHDIPYDSIFMRPEGDTRNDAIVKDELFETYIAPNYYVDFALDDRNRVVDMWRAKGIKCLQVAPGDF
jgi:predicted kinase